MTELPQNIEKLLREVDVGVKPWDDPFFIESHEVCRIFQPLGVYHVDEEEFCHPVLKEFDCNVAGCLESFDTLIQYETHYNGCHVFTCIDCKKVYPTERLLDIHIEETHDNFFKVLAEKKPMYQCFLADCNVKFSTPVERRQHAIQAHKFPKNYRYDEAPKSKSKKYTKKCKETWEKMQEDEQSGAEDSMEVDLLQVDTKNVENPKLPNKKEKATSKKQQSKKPNLYKNQKTPTFVSSHKNFVAKVLQQSSSENMVLEQSESEKKPTSTALVFIPRQLTHKPYSKVLTKGKEMVKQVLENNTMMDLAEALPQ